MPTIDEVLGAGASGTHERRFSIPATLHGAFGGAFGGLLAAACLQTARQVAPDRVPNALDCRFVRGLREPDAVATATVLHSGRSLTNVSVDLVDAAGKLCTRATISLVAQDALSPLEREGPPPGEWKAHAEAVKWPAVAPIVEAIDSRFVGEGDRTYATAVIIPWDEPGLTAEAACVALDLAVGPPAGRAAGSEPVATPNPDLSARFFGNVVGREVVGVGTLDRATNGLAAINLQAWSDGKLVATGSSTALLLPRIT